MVTWQNGGQDGFGSRQAIDTIIEPHFADTTSIYFFAGQDAQSTDLYRFSTSTLAIANLTRTNGVTSATLPLPAKSRFATAIRVRCIYGGRGVHWRQRGQYFTEVAA